MLRRSAGLRAFAARTSARARLALAGASVGLLLPMQAGAFELDEFFVGRFSGSGRFDARTASDSRTIRVTMVGTKTPNGVALKEDMTFSDGERRQFTWVFRKAADGSLTASRADIGGGPIPVYRQGDRYTLSYTAPVKFNGGDYNVNFTESYRQVDENTVENRSTASYFVTVGETTIIIRKAK